MSVKILLWLAVPLAVTALAMVWAAWYARRGDQTSPSAVTRARREFGPDDPAYARFSAAVQRPLPAGVVRARRLPERRSGVVVRRSAGLDSPRPGARR